MKTGEWLIPKEYYKPDLYQGKGDWEGDCFFVLAFDKQNMRIYGAKGHAYSHTARIRFNDVSISPSASGYFNSILDMVPVPDNYQRPIVKEQDLQELLIKRIFSIVVWGAFL